MAEKIMNSSHFVPSNPLLNYETGSSILATPGSFTPGHNIADIQLSLCPIHGGPSHDAAAASFADLMQSHEQLNPLRSKNHVGEAVCSKSLAFPKCVRNRSAHGHVMDTSQVEQNCKKSSHEHQKATAGVGNVGLEHQHPMIRQLNTISSANLKHKSTHTSGEVLQSTGGSCMASLHQALLYQQAQYHLSNNTDFGPSNMSDKILYDTQAQLLQNNQPVAVSQQAQLSCYPRGSNSSLETVFICSSPSAPPPGTLIDDNGVRPSHEHWRTTHQQSKDLRIPQRKVCLSLDKLQAVPAFDQPSKNLTSTSESSQRTEAQNAYKLFDICSPSAGVNQAPHLLAEYVSHASCTGPQFSTRELSTTMVDSMGRKPDTYTGYSVLEDEETAESIMFLENCLRDCNKKARRMFQETRRVCQEVPRPGVVKNLISLNLSEKDCLEEKYGVLVDMLKKHFSKAVRASVQDNIVNCMEELQQKVKTTYPSYGSCNSQVLKSLEWSSSLPVSWLQGQNESNPNSEYNHQAAHGPFEQKLGELEYHRPVLTFADVCVNDERVLDQIVSSAVDSTLQIEVRMMENEQVMIKLTSKDRPGLVTDVMFALQDLQLEVQHANICTVSGVLHDIFSAKVAVALAKKQTTSNIAEAIKKAIEKGNTFDSCSRKLATPQGYCT